MSLRDKLGLNGPTLYLMDGSAFVFRSFYAFRDMTRSDGFPTNALYITTRLLLKLVREERPAHFAFVLDGKGPNFRHRLFPAYKANRSATPEDLVRQIEPITRVIRLLGLPLLISDQVEADDCIASLACGFRDTHRVIIVGADKDLRQCLHASVMLWDPASKDERLTTLGDFEAENGFAPSSWPDYQALVGDSSDNIPGIPKIGPKTAQELIREFPTLESLFDRLAAVPPKIRPKLEGRRDEALLYRKLTTLAVDVCPTDIAGVTPAAPDFAALAAFLDEFELKALRREVESMERAGAFAPKPAAPAPKKNAPTSSAPAMPVDVPGEPAGTPLEKAGSGKTLPHAGGQGSLFNMQPKQIAFSRAAGFADLPSLGVAWAAFDLPEGLLLASLDWERLYDGRLEDLAGLWKKDIPVLVTADFKNLAKKYPIFWTYPEEHVFDISLAAWLLDPEERSYAWPHPAYRRADRLTGVFAPEEHPGLTALSLHELLRNQLAGAHLEPVYAEVELPLVPVLARMEERGIGIDRQAFADFLTEVQDGLEHLTKEIHSLAGRPFNIRSAQQLGDVLFKVLGLPGAGKTKGGAASTSQEALEKLEAAHPVVPKLLEYRKLEKLRSTYLEPMPRLVDAHDRLHTTFNQTGTATGRLSSSNPNLQNIPIRGPLGERMRRCFTAAPGKVLVCADYSQIELRVLAHLSQEPALLEAFHKGEDIHRRTAGLLYDVPQADVTPEQRRNAKTVNFGLIYGMGAQKLAKDLGISQSEAKGFISRYFERLPQLKDFYASIEKEAEEHGFVVTMTGRRRPIPDIRSGNNQLRSQARRQAVNTRIQGSAADIIKLAMPAVENDAELRRLGAVLLLQIHDELLLECPPETAQEAGERLAAIMSGVKPGSAALSVPLPADWGVGFTWADAH